MKNKKPGIFILPQFSTKIGYGHLKRSLVLYELLKKYYHVRMIYFKNRADEKVDYIFFQSLKNLINYLQQENPLFIILDFMYYPKNMVKELSSICKLIVFDSTKSFNTKKIVIHFNPTTPIRYAYLPKNIFIYDGLDYLPLNKNLIKYLDKNPTVNNNLFICFGNSDPNKLSLQILKILKTTIHAKNIFLNIGKYYKKQYRLILKNYLTEHFSNYKIIENKENIIPELFSCSYLISSFSITALEGLILSKKIGLYNNSLYHTKLSKFFNSFYYLGTYPFSWNFQLKRNMIKFLSNSGCQTLINSKSSNQNIIKIIKKIETITQFSNKIKNCPICGNKNIKLILNHIEKWIYHCKNCKSKFLKTQEKKDISKIYKNAYFNEEYKRQYGKTYLEDKNNILKLAEVRLKIITKLLKGKAKNKKILDIGCAYGFFLKKAKSFHFQPTGLEIEKNAVKYVKNKLKIKIIYSNFLNHHFKEKFDIITLWYVFEHFSDPEAVMNKILTILKPQGLLCFSFPNGNSPFYRFNKKEWLKTHADNHFFDYSIKGIKLFLKRKGLQFIKSRITGFHPERYRNCPRIFLPFLKPLRQGDTMELYFKYIA